MACCWINRVEVRSFPSANSHSLNHGRRAAIVNAGANKGRNILITGAGGGVALLAVQLSIAKGANVFVTSGSDEKIQKLLLLGVKGGVNYKHSERSFLGSDTNLNLKYFIS